MKLQEIKIENKLPVPPAPRPESEIISEWIDNTADPIVSVICITYNHVNFIEDTLNSILMQETNFPFEIIIHDDASTDGTTEIVKKYADAYPNIITPIIQTKNQWSEGKRPSKFTFKKAKGEYLALCEGDDYWISPDKLMVQINAMRSYPEVCISFHPAYRLDVSKNEVIDDFKKGELEQVFPVNDAVRSRDQYAPTASYIFKLSEDLALPEWFYTAKDLPFGDYFIETIMGRKGLLYLPDLRSVYRRNVLGSYTDNTKRASDYYLVNRMKVVLEYTDKLKNYSEISEVSIDERKKAIVYDYRLMSINRKSISMWRSINEVAEKSGIDVGTLDNFVSFNKTGFLIFIRLRKLLKKLRKIKIDFKT